MKSFTPERRDELRVSNGKIEGDPSLHSIGCAGRISSFSETDDGRYLITLAGISRFELQEIENKGTSYITGKVNWNKFESIFMCSF